MNDFTDICFCEAKRHIRIKGKSSIPVRFGILFIVPYWVASLDTVPRGQFIILFFLMEHAIFLMKIELCKELAKSNLPLFHLRFEK